MTVPASQKIDVNEAGRVLATLDDWRAIVFVLIFVIFVMIVERGLTSWQMRKEREKMWAVADKFGDAADKLTIQYQVIHALFARFESLIDDRERRP